MRKIRGNDSDAAGIRINKYMSDAGVCSRREADRLVEKGDILIDGHPVIPGQRVHPGQEVVYDGRVIVPESNLTLIALNKPSGIVCTTDRRREKNNVIDFINYPGRVYPIGRLDKESEGLLLLTNDGSLVNPILKASSYHEKEYVVIVDREITEDFLEGMASGVPILDTYTRRCSLKQIDDHSFSIVLTQGLNRQIRRMCEYFSYKVLSLKRVRIMNIQLGGLKNGRWRRVSRAETEELKRLLKI